MTTLQDILTPGRTACRVQGVSKKRLFETIANLVSQEIPALSAHVVLDQLNARERLGSTGMGGGIAIPHSRVENCPAPVGALLTLADPLPFDAPDDQPVDLLFVLLVPAEANQEHLDILAEIARLLSQDDICRRLRAANDADALYEIVSSESL